jgi:hypothetical protein
MWLIENKLVYWPVKASAAWEPAPSAAIQDVEFTSPARDHIHAWWLPARPDAPVLLLCPGNSGNLSGRGATIMRIVERLDTSVLIFDYPGYGKSTGRPSERACYAAAAGAIHWLKCKHGVPPERVILYGESLGGGVATEMATQHACQALVLVKTFTSLPAVAKRFYPWLPVRWLMSNRFDILAKLPNIRCPVFITSATADTVIPYEHGETLFKVANEPKHFYRDEGNDHDDSLPDGFWDELRQFLGRHACRS